MKKIENLFTKILLLLCLISLIGLNLNLQRIKLRVKRIEQVEVKSRDYLFRITKELVIKDEITEVQGVKFYVPFYSIDLIQRVLVETGLFFEQRDILEPLNKYLNEESIVFDAGANIGNHTLYWAKKTGVKKVYAFEPVDKTFDILEKNISLNNLENTNKVIINHVGLGKFIGKASVVNYDLDNIGATQIKMDTNGNLNVITLDGYVKNNFTEDRIDFLKIDVEGFEYDLLLGAKDVLVKYSPIILVESFKNEFERVNKLLESYGYKLKESFPGYNYLYLKEHK